MVWMEKAEGRTWLSQSLLLALPSCALFVALSSCSEARVIGTAVVPDDGGTFSPLAPIDAGAEASVHELISYCPSSQCPPGWTTCPDSRFPCDTNVLADPRNCGACGNACPAATGYELFSCNEGACRMQCNAAPGVKDCDGLIDNGCESSPLDPANCGACGVACAVGQTCKWLDSTLSEVGCECPPGEIDCGICRDPNTSDGHCGACNNECDPEGRPGAPRYPNTYYGCGGAECGKLKCFPSYRDCDGDLENGCETWVETDDHCGECGNACGAGTKCRVDDETKKLACLCGQGFEFCETREREGAPIGICVDVSSDANNCGGCGVSCGAGAPNRVPKCDYGKCILGCIEGWEDCNGAESDGCEVDARSDPRNCGGCGITCDLTLGQACVAGKCVVEPCDRVDAGEVTR